MTWDDGWVLPDWLRRVFRRYEPSRLPPSESERAWQAEMDRRWREEQDYRRRFGPMRHRGQTLADDLNRTALLPAGVSFAFDDYELREAHRRLREDEARERNGWAR